MLRKLFCLFAIAQLCAICARSQTLYVNNVKAVRDVNTHIFYATADAIPPIQLIFKLLYTSMPM